MKLEVGMYARINGDIRKVTKIDGDNIIFDGQVNINYFGKRNKIKASYNIIDLIKVGDYVNGSLVIEEPYRYHDIEFVSLDTRDSWGHGKGEIPATNIKSIVTREQFERMKYELE